MGLCYSIVLMILTYYIQTFCLKPREKMVSRVLLGALPMVVIVALAIVVEVSWQQFLHGSQHFLFFHLPNIFDILSALVLVCICIELLIGMFAGVVLAWIVYAIKRHKAKKEYNVDTEDEGNGYYEESDG